MGDIRPIDEVIEALSICRNVDPYRVCRECPYPDTEGCMDMLMGDALYYLKMYRSDMQIYAVNQKLWEDKLKQKIKDFGDAKERYIKRLKELDIGTLNNPLTWDELKTMERKPVWIEADNGQEQFKHWFIVDDFTPYDTPEKQIMWCMKESYRFKKEDLGKTWRAYRKEIR